jgi:hypothetical protein
VSSDLLPSNGRPSIVDSVTLGTCLLSRCPAGVIWVTIFRFRFDGCKHFGTRHVKCCMKKDHKSKVKLCPKRISYIRKNNANNYLSNMVNWNIEPAPRKGPETLKFSHPTVEVMCLPTYNTSVLDRIGQEVINTFKFCSTPNVCRLGIRVTVSCA